MRSSAALHSFEVLRRETLARDTYRMALSCAVAETIRPGQFVEIAVPGDASHILRIPLSFSRADARGGVLELIFAVVGEGTARLAAMEPGDASTLVGPLGNGWSVPEGTRRVLLVAGGAGLPPIMAAARMLAEGDIGFDAVASARTAELLITAGIDEIRTLTPSTLCDCGRRVRVTTDDGTGGERGFATDAMASLMDERTYDLVLTCGPTPMMHAVAELARERGVAAQVSLERMMGCGFGACSCCNVEMADGSMKLCCQDGPVFDAEEVAWR